MKIRFLLFTFFIVINSHLVYPQIQSENYLKGAMITGIVESGNLLWISTYGEGIYKLNKSTNKWLNLSTKNKNGESDFFFAIAASKSYVWAGAADGLYIYNIRTKHWRKRKFSLGGEMGNWIRALCYDPSKKILWIGRFENLTMLDVRRQRYTDFVLTQGKDAKSDNIKSIRLDGDSLVWFGTESGVFKYNKGKNIHDKNSWLYINNKDGGFLNEGNSVSISDMLFDPEKVWFGTDEFLSYKNPNFNVGGIYLYNREHNWERISIIDGLPANGIYCLERTGNKIWAGVYYFDKKEKKDYGRGLVLIDRLTNKVTPVNLNDINIESSKILCLYFDGTYMWIGTDNGLTKVLISNQLAIWPGKKTKSTKKKSSRTRSRYKR